MINTEKLLTKVMNSDNSDMGKINLDRFQQQGFKAVSLFLLIIKPF